MFAWNAAFVMCLLAISFARVKSREWFSSSVVVIVLALVAMSSQRSIVDLFHGVPIGKIAGIWLIWLTLMCLIALKQIFDDAVHRRKG